MEKKKCACCQKQYLVSFFNEKSGENCVFCFADNGGKADEVEKSTDFEMVEDKGCAGGACTL